MHLKISINQQYKITNFVRYSKNQELLEYLMDEVENLIKDEANKNLLQN